MLLDFFRSLFSLRGFDFLPLRTLRRLKTALPKLIAPCGTIWPIDPRPHPRYKSASNRLASRQAAPTEAQSCSAHAVV